MVGHLDLHVVSQDSSRALYKSLMHCLDNNLRGKGMKGIERIFVHLFLINKIFPKLERFGRKIMSLSHSFMTYELVYIVVSNVSLDF